MKLNSKNNVSLDPVTATVTATLTSDKPSSTVEYHRRSRLIPPPITIDNFKGWQLQALTLFQQKSRKLHILYDSIGTTGKTAFLEALIHNNLEKYLIFDGVPSPLDFENEIEMREKKCRWSGHCLIFNLYRSFKSEDMYRTLELAADNAYCASVWVFTTRMPDLSQLSKGRWEIYTLDHNEGKEDIPTVLFPLSFEEALQVSRSGCQM